MKARFAELQPPVRVVDVDDRHYVYICLNEVVGQEEVLPPIEYPDEIPEEIVPPEEALPEEAQPEETPPEETAPASKPDEPANPPVPQYVTYYEYDYNEFVAGVEMLPDIQAYPENYLDYVAGNPPKTIDERVTTLEEDVSGIESAIKEALNA